VVCSHLIYLTEVCFITRLRAE